jgi:hypothetical protein
MKKRPMTQDDLVGFIERTRFLENLWNCRTDFSIDQSTGRGWLRICPPTGETVLHIDHIDARDIRLIERCRTKFPDLPTG